MAEELTFKPPAQLDKPPGAPGTPPPGEPVIHVIPDKFYGAALRKKVVEPPKTPPPGYGPGQAPRPGVPQPPRPTAPPRPRRKGGGLVVAIVMVLLLGAGGVGYFGYTQGWFDQIIKPPAKPPAGNQNLNVNVPPAPVCGNGQCEATETADNCAADCRPKPVCGDGKCEAPDETTESCSADCAPPAPVCGDGKCEDPETDESCSADCQPPEPELGPDADNDGVSDVEEEAIYGINKNDPDSDHDSFVDLNEIYNLFNPALPAPSMLRDNPGIAAYSNVDQGYEVLRPAGWSVREAGENRAEVFFTAPDGEFVEVLAQVNPDNLPLMDWYLEQSPGVRSSDVQVFRTKGGYEEVLSPDRMTAFVAVDGRVYVISYNLANQNFILYRSTFAMVANSLKALPQ